MSAYSFPTLDPDELLACLEDMELQFDAAQLAKPTQPHVQRVYEHIVLLLTGLTRWIYLAAVCGLAVKKVFAG
jgi:hypothetical protein